MIKEMERQDMYRLKIATLKLFMGVWFIATLSIPKEVRAFNFDPTGSANTRSRPTQSVVRHFYCAGNSDEFPQVTSVAQGLRSDPEQQSLCAVKYAYSLMLEAISEGRTPLLTSSELTPRQRSDVQPGYLAYDFILPNQAGYTVVFRQSFVRARQDMSAGIPTVQCFNASACTVGSPLGSVWSFSGEEIFRAVGIEQTRSDARTNDSMGLWITPR